MPFGLWKKKAQVTADRQRQVDLGYAARQLELGDLSPVAGDGDVLSLDNIAFLEPRLAQTVQGGIKGRIARGLYFYVAQPPESGQELAEADRGAMTIAAEGISFAGRTRHVGIGFGAIESVGHTQDAITIAAGAQRLHFGAGGAEISLQVQDRAYSQPLSGRLLRLLVEAMIKRSPGGRDET